MCTDLARMNERVKENESVQRFLKGYGSAASVGLVSCLRIKTFKPRVANSDNTHHSHINGGEIIYDQTVNKYTWNIKKGILVFGKV